MKVLVGRENIVKFSRNFVVRSRGFISPLTLTSLTAGNRSDFAISQTISENISQREKKAYFVVYFKISRFIWSREN